MIIALRLLRLDSEIIVAADLCHTLQVWLAMFKLIQYGPALGALSASPFCTKAEMLLKLSKLDYENEIWQDPRRAPKGKLPVLRDGDELIADSSVIRRHLEEKHAIDFDIGLSPADKAVADAFVKLCEEHLYWVAVHSRWQIPSNWEKIKMAYFGHIPALIRPLILPRIRRESNKQIHGHGMGRHSEKEIYEFGSRDLKSLSNFLGEKKYLMGDSPSGVDATLFGFLDNILHAEIESPLKEAAKSHQNLVDYAARIRGEFFSA